MPQQTKLLWHFIFIYNNSKYIIFSKTTSKAISSRIYDIDDFSKAHLIMTRELNDNN